MAQMAIKMTAMVASMSFYEAAVEIQGDGYWRLPGEAGASRSGPGNGVLFRFVPAVAVEAMRAVPGIKTAIFRREMDRLFRRSASPAVFIAPSGDAMPVRVCKSR
jgi:hypothetical protein